MKTLQEYCYVRKYIHIYIYLKNLVWIKKMFGLTHLRVHTHTERESGRFLPSGQEAGHEKARGHLILQITILVSPMIVTSH